MVIEVSDAARTAHIIHARAREAVPRLPWIMPVMLASSRVAEGLIITTRGGP
jgi:hypothetical protein